MLARPLGWETWKWPPCCTPCHILLIVSSPRPYCIPFIGMLWSSVAGGVAGWAVGVVNGWATERWQDRGRWREVLVWEPLGLS